MQKPFDVTTIMSDLDETLVQETHDAPRTGAGAISPAPRYDFSGDLRSPASRPDQSPEAIQEARPDAGFQEDAINPSHYRKHPSGIECIEVTRHMNFNTGNAIKYIWRYLDKGDPVENLKKAQWYIDDEIRRLEGKR